MAKRAINEPYEVDVMSNGNSRVCYVYPTRRGNWYVLHGGNLVNLTRDEIGDGTDIEAVTDCNTFTWSGGIESPAHLEIAVEA